MSPVEQVDDPSGQLQHDPAPDPPDGRPPPPGLPAAGRAAQRHLALGELDRGGGTRLAAPVQGAGDTSSAVRGGRGPVWSGRPRRGTFFTRS
jgi:hypothetical protein